MIVIVLKYLIPKGFSGLTIFPFIILRNDKDRSDAVLLNHEKIHIRQQMELLVIPFFIWYFIEYGIRWIKYRDKNLAYRKISFEKEAYENEKDLHYLKQRSFWSFEKYLIVRK